MLGVIGPLISGIGGIGSSLFGAMSSQNAQNANLMWQYYNAQMQDRANRRAYELQTAGRENAFGDKVEYIPGRGYVTTASGSTKRLADAERAEALMRLLEDMPESRERRDVEGSQADRYLNQLNRPSPHSRSSLQSLLLRRGTEGINEGYDNVQQDMSRQFIRSGTKPSNIGANFSQLAKQRADAQRRNRIDADLDSYNLSDQMTRAHEAHKSGLYNLFASRASNYNNVPFQPMQPAAQPDAMLGQMSALSQSAVRNPMPINANIQPSQLGYSFGGVGDLFGSLFESMYGGMSKQQSKDIVKTSRY